MTFVSPDEAYVLGYANCPRSTCSEILRTTDRGQHWVGLPAPLENDIATNDGSYASLIGLRFADTSHGYAFGHGEWVTSDGSQHWSQVPVPGGYVEALEPVGDQTIIAVSANCHSQHGCTHQTIDTGGIDGKLRPVTAVPGDTATPSIAVRGSDAFVLVADRLFRSSDSGAHFAEVTTPCHSQPGFTATSVAFSTSDVWLLCAGEGAAGSTQKRVYSSADGGQHWTLAGRPGREGDPGSITASPGGEVMVSAQSGGSIIYRSSDGRGWHQVLSKGDGGAGWADLGFTTNTDAVVIHHVGSPDMGRLLLSDDGGMHWSPVPLRG